MQVERLILACSLSFLRESKAGCIESVQSLSVSLPPSLSILHLSRYCLFEHLLNCFTVSFYKQDLNPTDSIVAKGSTPPHLLKLLCWLNDQIVSSTLFVASFSCFLIILSVYIPVQKVFVNFLFLNLPQPWVNFFNFSNQPLPSLSITDQVTLHN